MKKVIHIIVNLILAYLSTIAIAGVSGYGITGIEIILPCLFVLAIIVYSKAYDRCVTLTAMDANKKALKREVFCSLPVGLLLSAAITVGSHYDIWNQTITSIGVFDAVYFALLAVFITASVFVLYGLLDGLKKNSDTTQKKTADIAAKQGYGIRIYAIITAVILVCWLPYYLTFLPGNIGTDVFEEVNMCLGNIPWTNHHPVFFTMLLSAVIKLTGGGNLNLALGIFTTVQMIIFAMTLTYIATWIRRKTSDSVVGRRASIVSILFFAVCPVFPMFAMYISKDVLFSCAMVMLTLSLYELLDLTCCLKKDSDGKSEKTLHKDLLIKIGIWSLFTMLLRNNGMMIVVLMGVVLVITNRKYWKQIALAVATPVIVFALFRGCSYGVLDIMPQSFAESASIPLQQTGYVIAHSSGDYIEGLTEEENAVLTSIIPYDRVREVYELGYTDMLKFDTSFDDVYFNEHSADYMKIWLHLLPAHFSDYVKAYLAQTAGYWHYGESNTLCTQGVTENSLGIVQADVISHLTGFSLNGLVEKLMLLMRKAPVVCMLCSMAVQIYMVLLLVCNYIRKKRGILVVALMPVILLWITIMVATPAFCLFRYTFTLFLLWPVFIKELAE